MKKIVAMMLALLMVLVSVSAMAADADTTTSLAAGTKIEIPIDKSYYLSDGTTKVEVSPEDLAFSIVSGYTDDTYTNPAEIAANITVAGFNTSSTDPKITLTLPEITKAGKYNFTITENANTATQGIVSSSQEIRVSFVVEYDYSTNPRSLKFGAYNVGVWNGTEKDDELNNTVQTAALDVTKQVSGNMADQTASFNIDVTFTSETGKVVKSDILGALEDATPAVVISKTAAGWTEKTYRIALKHGETYHFTNIPAGVTYEVEEDSAHIGDPSVHDGDKGYTVAYTNGTDQLEADDKPTATVTNTKKLTPDTGIALDAVPYMMIMAIALMGAAMMIVRRREEM